MSSYVFNVHTIYVRTRSVGLRFAFFVRTLMAWALQLKNDAAVRPKVRTKSSQHDWISVSVWPRRKVSARPLSCPGWNCQPGFARDCDRWRAKSWKQRANPYLFSVERNGSHSKRRIPFMADKKPASRSEKKKKAEADETGKSPLCTAMFACDNVIVADDKTVSIIRIIDSITLSAEEKHKMGSGLDFSNLRFFAAVKAGGARGKLTFLLLCTDPRGSSHPIGSAEATFDNGPESGANIISPLRLHWGGSGVYWFELQYNGLTLARTPIKLIKSK